MNVIICGGRTFENYDAVERYLDMLHDLHGFTLVIHGRARGADTCAHRWAGARKIPVEMFPAHWRLHGNSAGAIRNKQMLVEGRPGLVVAFPGGDGTADMRRQAQQANVPVVDLQYEKTRATVTAQWKTHREGSKAPTSGVQPTSSATATGTSDRSAN